MITTRLLATLLLSTSAFAVDTATATDETPAPARPTHIGVLGMGQFAGLDAYGPIEFFNAINLASPGRFLFNFSVIAEEPGYVFANARNTTALFATSTFAAPSDIDVLLIPGGPASRAAIKNPVLLDYVRDTYPKLKYILSVCTGAQILAKAGLLDGRNATTNKAAWKEMTPHGPKTNWIGHARWVVDGNVWTSSGVTAGTDMAYAFLLYAFRNQTLVDRAANLLEHIVSKNALYDPFADAWGVVDVPPLEV